MRLIKSLLLTLILFTAYSSQAQFNLGNMAKKAANSLTNPSADEIGAGIKEALEKGVSAGADRLSLQDGFMGNAAVKLLFPPEAQKIEKTLRGLGMNKLCDDFVMSMNRAAEEAAKEAKPIFVSAIKQMTIKDATTILIGGKQDAATQYFKKTTTDQLKLAFQPVIKSNLEKVGATKYWADVTTAYNKIPLVSKVNTDLEAYATQKSVDGLFYEVAQEELKIRTNTSARNSPLLLRVFNYADSKQM